MAQPTCESEMTPEPYKRRIPDSYNGSRDGDTTSLEEGSLKPADSTRRTLKPRHIQMIGMGGTIGTALYVQIGQSLKNGGPASLFIAFTFWYVPASLRFYPPCVPHGFLPFLLFLGFSPGYSSMVWRAMILLFL